MAAAPRTRTAAAPSTPTSTAARTYGAYGGGAYTPIRRVRRRIIRPGYPAYPAAYPAYHPPVAVPYYSSGCYGCAAAAGAVVGVAVGAAVGLGQHGGRDVERVRRGRCDRQRQHRRRDQRRLQRRRCHRGHVAGAPASGTYVMGVNYAALPAGSMTINKNGATYYLNGNTWFQPSYGANGVYYTVVPAP